jgi:tetratricopeptide (TPR) repeat protein
MHLWEDKPQKFLLLYTYTQMMKFTTGIAATLCGAVIFTFAYPHPLVRAQSTFVAQLVSQASANDFLVRGDAKFKKGDFKGAIADYDQAIRLNSTFVAAFANRGSARAGAKDYKGAIEDFDQAIRLNPRAVAVYVNRGDVRLETKDYKGAIADYNQAIRLSPKDATAYYNRGVARANLRERMPAMADFQKAAQLARAQKNSQLLELANNALK